ncbi:MAG TPA: potassium transporter Kup, partial [Longimicrobiaceae bacterium]|nr:potassium transporter Kup [Longimicrobiaceae bacterium]
VLGVLSLIFWALIVVVTLKYLVLVLRADNRGEGGILALTALVTPLQRAQGGRRVLILLGLFGTALLYGEGMITPAISVLSAVEGLQIATPFFEPYVIPLTIAVIVALFLVQSRGTARVGTVFGPITVVWFLVLAALGIRQIAGEPGVLAAVSPHHGLRFLAEHGWHGFLVLGSVVLVVTGAEALYADIGHFGKRPIRLTWIGLVLPALLLNYFGQGALLIGNPDAAANPFYRMAPVWALYPLVVLATAATVIASQALISGAFSLTRQAVQLGYSPRLRIEHTSAREIGQIYIPAVNWGLMIACIALVLGFRTSSNLAAAYGLAVTATMTITTLLLFVVMRDRWRWSLPVAGLLAGFFLVIDLAFFGANLTKVLHGGWFPLVVGAVLFTLLTTWKRGRRILRMRMESHLLPLETFLKEISVRPPLRVPGTAVFLFGDPTGVPPALLHNLKHNKVLHERVLLLNVITEEVPQVPEDKRLEVESLGGGFHRVRIHYGFMQDPNIPQALEGTAAHGLMLKPMETTYFLGRETLIPTRQPGMARWREQLFAWMSRNSQNATAYFCLPPNRVVELGAQVEL